MNFEEAKVVLKEYNQEHIIKIYERLDSDKKQVLLNQISKIDFEQLKTLYDITQKKIDCDSDRIKPLDSFEPDSVTETEKKKFIQFGEDIIKSGKYAVVTMAGGQGTRLGHIGPKGTYDLGLPSHKSLFEILCDKLKETQKKYNVEIPWYIMTSNENNDATVEFFEKNNYFGYPKDKIRMFFRQTELPMLLEDGKIVINEEGMIKLASDGHGGVFSALYKNGALNDMQKEGVEWVFISGVDNVLVQLVDPLFVGYSTMNNYITSSKTVLKAYPDEKVGVFCMKNENVSVIEYTELPEELANMRKSNGELLFGESHVLLNLYNISFLQKVAEVSLPYHVAHKKTTYMNENGDVIVPDKPNAYKFETFLFDAFNMADNVGLFRGKRENDFSPVKNAEGIDSPETARRDYLNFYKNRR